MRVAIFVLGSRGDVQPFLTLSAGLISAGHEVIFFVDSSFLPLIASMGLTDKMIVINMGNFSFEAYFKQPVAQKLLKNQDVVGFLHFLQKLCDDIFPENSKIARETCFGSYKPDIILTHIMFTWITVPIAEGLKIPIITAISFPYMPSSSVPPVCMSSYPFSFPLNIFHEFLYDVQAFIVSRITRIDHTMQNFQTQCNATKMSILKAFHRNLLFDQLTFCSPVITSISYDAKKYIVHECGPLLDSAAVPFRSPFNANSSAIFKKLECFLQESSNKPPVYIGFGSMAGDNLHRVTLIALESVMKLGRKAVLHAGWAHLSIDSDIDHNSKDKHTTALLQYAKENVFELNESVPHYWLFPQCSVIVHHGGSGTTHAALASGRPQVICPVLADQFYWAYRLGLAGCASKKYTSAFKITVGEMTGFIQEMLLKSSQENAKAIGEVVLTENGLDRAVQAIEDITKVGGDVYWKSVYTRQQQIALESKRNLLILAGIVFVIIIAIMAATNNTIMSIFSSSLSSNR